MRIQFLGGGLANQIRQYVFVRYAERRFPDQTWLFDDSYFFTKYVAHNGYELEKIFGIKANLLSTQFDTDTWQYILKQVERGMCLPQIFLDVGLATVLVSEPSFRGCFNGVNIKNRGNDPEVLNLPYSHVYCYDYWVDDQWFRADQEENRAELMFPPLQDTKNLEYADQITSHFSVGIHVRRGDFLNVGWKVPDIEYQQACKEIADAYPDAWFIVFSDDLEWCKQHVDDMGFDLSACTVFVSGNVQGKNYIDMQLLSMCDGIIRPAQSSFSQVAAWLDRDLLFERKLGKTFD